MENFLKKYLILKIYGVLYILCLGVGGQLQTKGSLAEIYFYYLDGNYTSVYKRYNFYVAVK